MSDYQLPGMDGLEFFDAVREEHPDLPFILFTEDRFEGLARDAISAGVTDLLDKDLDTDRFVLLANRVEDAVRSTRAERRFEENRRRFRSLLGNLPGVVYRCDFERGWPMNFVSDGCAALTGYDPTELVEGTVGYGADAVHPDDRDRVWNTVREAIEAREPYRVDHRIRTADGEEKWVREQGRGVFEGGAVTALEGFITEITDRKESETTLEYQSSLLEAQMETTIDGLLVVDGDRNVVSYNESFVEMWEIPDELLQRQSDDELLDWVVDHKLADPDEFWTLVEELYENPAEASRDEVRLTDGRVFDRYSAPVVGDDGTDYGRLWMFRDITEQQRYEAELEQLNEELEILNRVVRHDIRNDMTVILGWIEVLSEHVDEAGREYIEKITSSSEHVVELTEIVRDYVETLAGDDEMDTAPTSLGPILEKEIALRQEANPDAEISVRGSVPEVEVQANEMLASGFRNLLNNAVQHNDAETPVVEVVVDDRADEVQVTVSDNGPGISDGQKERIFGKDEKGLDSPGSGIGLYLVETLIEAYGGDIGVEDADSGGVAFTVTLPKPE